MEEVVREGLKANPQLFEGFGPSEEVERSRALMEEVPLYLRGVQQRGGLVKAGVVENVVDVRAWDQWDRWIGEIRKLASAPAFHLKGTGWYATDYAKVRHDEIEGQRPVGHRPRAVGVHVVGAGVDARGDRPVYRQVALLSYVGVAGALSQNP